MRTPSFLAALATTVLLAAPASARTWEQAWTVGAHPSVVITTNDARVRIHRGGAGHVSTIVEYTLNVWGAHTKLQDPTLEFGRNGDAITISARSHPNGVFFGGMVDRFHVDVTVPATCDVQVRSGDGGVDVDAITGTLDVRTGDGHIAVHGARGTLNFWTGDGGIDADSLDGSVDARSGDGHLKVAGRFDRLALRSGDGHVRATVGRGSTLAAPWSLETGDGGVTLLVPRGLQALLDVTCRDGHVKVELPASGIPAGIKRSLRGQLNGGTMPLRVHTGDGSVSIGLSE